MNRKGIRRWVFIAMLLLVIGSLMAVFFPVAPHGRFTTPQVANLGDAFIEAIDGKLTQVIFGGRRGREGREHRIPIGDYRKVQGRWIVVTPGGSTGWLSATLLSLKIVDDTGQQDGPYYRYEIYKGR